MPIEILDCEQRTEEWYRARMGIPTASEFATVLAKGRAGAPSKMRQTYLYKLAGEILTGQPMENYSNHHMERGQLMEDEARRTYEFMSDVEVQRVGFIRNGNKGASPDALIGDGGTLEIKTKLPHLLLPILLKNEFPPEHKPQCQGQLWVTERSWIDLVIYWPGLPLFVKRAERDEDYIAELDKAVARFNDELAQIVKRVNSYG